MMTSLSFYFALLLLQANPAFYSSSSFCATDLLLEQQLQDEEYAHKHQAFEKRLKAQIENGQIANYRALYTLPVVVHVIHQGGAENISDAQVLQAIDDLNAAFANDGYYDQGTGLDTEIQFCLAQRDPDGNPTSGINRVNNALTSLTLETQDVAMKDLSRWNPLEYINIWVVGEICSSSVGCGVAGYAFFPSSHGMPEDGLVVESNYFGNSQANSAVLVHEMGHYLGVYHTFQNGCTNNDCLSDGDRVCDTPPDQSTVPVPCGQSVNTCSSDVNAADPNNPFTTDQNDMYWNYMDYGDVDCYSAFTPGQTDRMYFSINDVRSSLLTSQGCEEPCTNPLDISFTIPSTTIEIGSTVNLTNTSTNANDFEWQINGTPFASSANASYNFNQLGTFTITLFGANGSPFCEGTFEIEVEVICNTFAQFDANATLVGIGETVSFANTTINGVNYTWTINGVVQSNALNYNHVFNESDIYEVCLTANGPLCADTYCSYVVVTEEADACEGGSTYLKTYVAGVMEEGYAITSAEDGNIYVGGSHGNGIFIMKMTPGGEPIWNKSLDAVSSLPEQLLDFRLDSENKLLICGYGGSNSFNRVGFVMRYDPATDDIMWIHRSTSGSATYLKVMEKTAGGEIVVFGQTEGNAPPGQGCDAIIFHIDRNDGSEGSWRKNFHRGSCETFQGADVYNGQFYVTGRYNYAGGGTNKMRSSASRLNFDGTEDWSRNYLVSTATTARLYSPDLLIDNNEIVIVHRGDKNGTSATNPECYLTKSNLNGELIWAKQYVIDANTNISFINIINLPDGYAILGHNVTDGNLFILKTDKDGNQIWAREYGLAGGIQTTGSGTRLLLDNIYLYFAGWRNGQLMLGKVNFLDGELGGECPEDEAIEFIITNFPGPVQDLQTLTIFDSPISVSHSNISFSDFTPIVEDQCEGGLADATVSLSLLECQLNSIQLEIEICNDGEEDLPADTPVTFYQGDPTEVNAPILLSLPAIPLPVPAGDCITFPIPVPEAYDEDIFVVVNDDGSVNRPFDLEDDFPIGDPTECIFINNMDSIVVEGGFPILDLGPDIEICDNGTALLDAGDGFDTYEWSTLENTQTITAFEPGTYSVTVTAGCLTQTDQITITIDPATILDLGPDLVACPGESLTISAPGDFERFRWVPSDFLDCDTCQTVTASPDTAVVYTVLASNENGCVSTDTIVVNFGLISVADTIYLCQGESTVIFGEEVSGDGTYQDTIFNTETCDTALTITTIELDAIQAILEVIPTCFEDSTGQVIVNVSGGLPPYQYNWQPVLADTDTLNNLPAGNYQLTITDANDCELEISTQVENVPEVSFDYEVANITCFGEGDGQVQITNATDGLTFSLDGTVFQTELSFDSLQAGDYVLFYQDIFGCIYSTAFAISEPEELVVDLPEVDLIPLGESVTVQAISNGQEPLSYNWFPPEIVNCDTCQQVTISPLFNEDLMVIVTDPDGCTTSATIALAVLKDRKVYIPNVFSPNDDGFNDRFNIFASIEVDQILEMQIFDRWGELIWENENFPPNDTSIGWDGTFRGKDMNSGIFVYKAKIRFIDGFEKDYKGDIFLIR